MLKLLNGIIKPDRGRIEMKGRVGALIALGAGFSPVLTGRENVYINGSILGLSRKEVNDNFDAIVAFSELSDFIDAPVQSYSSGMRVRLGFAVAAILIKPDILLLDEVLAVGDRSFISKCVNTVRELMATSAVVLVSHNMRYIANFCNRAILMDAGGIALETHDVSQAIERYSGMVQPERRVFASPSVKFYNARMLADRVENQDLNFDVDASSVKLQLELEIVELLEPCNCSILLRSTTEEPVLNFLCTDAAGKRLRLTKGFHDLEVCLAVGDLNFDQYTLDFMVLEEISGRIHLRVNGAASFQVIRNGWGWAKILRRAVCHHVTSEIASER